VGAYAVQNAVFLEPRWNVDQKVQKILLSGPLAQGFLVYFFEKIYVVPISPA
jgi:hypothetical protein